MNPLKPLYITLLLLEAVQVVFLWLHDWIPVGRLNNVAAIRREDTSARLTVVTLIQAVPFTLGLVFTALFFAGPAPLWVMRWLWISYGVLFLGQLRAWWIPYLFVPDPKRAARYQIIFANTHSFLPERHGMVPNTFHILLHLSTLATLVVLATLQWK